MQHLSIEEIVQNADPSAAGPTQAASLKHLEICAECTEKKLEFATLIHQLREQSSFEPPAETLQWGLDLFQPMLRPASGSRLKRIIAALVFDNYDQPLPAGVRNGAAPARQLLFRAGDIDVDVKIEATEAEDRLTLVGQVLSTEAEFFDNTSVKLESHGVVRYRTLTNPIGEFSFDEVPKDTYHLSVELPEGQITLFCVHRGAS